MTPNVMGREEGRRRFRNGLNTPVERRFARLEDPHALRMRTPGKRNMRLLIFFLNA